MAILNLSKDYTDSLPGSLRSVLEKQENTRKFGKEVIQSLVPGRELATGLAAVFSFGEVQKQEQYIQNSKRETQSILRKAIQEERNRGNVERAQAIARRGVEFADGTTATEQFVESAPNTRQVLASAGELALFAGLGLKTKMSGWGFANQNVMNAAKLAQNYERIEKLKNAGTLTRLGIKAMPYAREATIGSAFFSLIKAQEKDAKTEDIVEAAEVGALLGPLTMAAFSGTAKFFEKTKPIVQKGFKYLEDKAIKIKNGLEKPTNTVVDEVLGTIGEKKTFKQISAETYLKGVDQVRQFKQRWVDRGDPLKRVQDKIRGIKGDGKLTQDEAIYRDFRLATSIADQEAEVAVTRFSNEIRKYDDIIDDGKAYLTLLDYTDRAKLGNKTPLGDSIEELNTKLMVMADELGPDTMKRLGQLRNTVSDYNVSLLDERVEAGLISQAERDALLKAHPNYIPHDVIMSVDEKAYGRVGNSFNVSKSDIMKAFGSVKNITDPFEAMMSRTVITKRLIEYNKVLRNLADVQNKYGVVEGMRAVRTAENVERRGAILNRFKETRKELNKLQRKFSSSKKFSKSIQTKISQLNREIGELEGTFSKEFGEFVSPAVSKTRVTGEKLAQRASKIDRLDFIEERLRNIDKVSADDAVKFIDDTIGLIKNERKVLNQELRTLAEEKIPEGMGSINFMRNGIKETWVVPRDIENVFKNTPGLPQNLFTKVLLGFQNTLKKGATSYNPSFTIQNFGRDRQTAFFADSFIDEVAKFTGVSKESVNLSREAIEEAYKTSGTFGSSIFAEGDDQLFNKLIKDGVVTKSFKNEFNPITVVKNINEAVEQSTRMQVFERALRAGLSKKDAALVSREATIDFAKMGTYMQNVNRAVPFLNARLQGFVNIGRAFVNNPELFARVQLYTSAYPTLLLHSHNRRFDSYKSISQDIKNRYWVIMTGETEARDSYTGERIIVPQFVTVAKGEAQSLVSSPLQWYLDRADGTNYQNVSEMLASTLGNASPLAFQSYRGTNMFTTIFSQLGPVGTIPFGLASNVNPFYGTNIVPEERLKAKSEVQVKKDTPESTRALAGVIGVSPARLEFVLNSFGGLPQDIQDGLDIVYGLVKGDATQELRDRSISGTDFGVATQAPIARRFLREASDFYSPESEFRKKQKELIEIEVNTKNANITDRANEIIEKFNRLPLNERKEYLAATLPLQSREVIEKFVAGVKSRSTVEVLKKTDRVEVRAAYILQRINEIKSSGSGSNVLGQFLADLRASKILTEDVAKMLVGMMQYYQ